MFYILSFDLTLKIRFIDWWIRFNADDAQVTMDTAEEPVEEEAASKAALVASGMIMFELTETEN